MLPASGLGHKQAGGFAFIACLFVPYNSNRLVIPTFKN